MPKGIMSYRSQNMKFSYGLEKSGLFCPKFQPALIDEIQLQNAFGKFELQKNYAQCKAPNSHKMMKNPAIANINQSPLKRSSCLMRIACGGTENIWASRNDSQLYAINNKSGAVLKNVKAANDVIALSIDSDQNVVFIYSFVA